MPGMNVREAGEKTSQVLWYRQLKQSIYGRRLVDCWCLDFTLSVTDWTRQDQFHTKPPSTRLDLSYQNTTIHQFLHRYTEGKCSDAHLKSAWQVRYCMGYTARMADLHKGWGKTSAAGHGECMGNSKCVLKRSISLQHGKTDRLHALIIATQRAGVFISEANGHIGVWCVALIAWKAPMVELMMSSIMLFIENG